MGWPGYGAVPESRFPVVIGLFEWLAWAFILALLTWCLATIGWVADRSAEVRWLGMFFQLTGVFIVLVQLDDSLRTFGELSLLERIAAFLGQIRAMVWRSKRVRHLTADPLTGSGTIVGLAPIVSDGSLEGRVTALEAIVKKLQQDVYNFRDNSNQTFERERNERQKLGGRLKKVTIGGANLVIGGFLYLFFGIIFATVPEVIACLLQRIGF